MIRVRVANNNALGVQLAGENALHVHAIGEAVNHYITISDISFKEIDQQGNYVYTITMTDGATYEFTAPKGPEGETGTGIQSAYLNADYTLTLEFTDGTSYTTPVIRGATGVGVDTILWLDGDHSPGTFDTYRILMTDESYTDFQVYNGADAASKILCNTTATWNSQPQLVAAAGTLYIYSDHSFDQGGNPVPGFKVGDGNAYLIDIPFADTTLQEQLEEHIADTEVHITESEREFWNNKERCYTDNSDPETLIFTKE